MTLLYSNKHWLFAAMSIASSPVPSIVVPEASLLEVSSERACEISLKGSPCSLALQNTIADSLALARLQEDQLEPFKENGVLVPLPDNETVRISASLSKKYRWCLPTTRAFILELGRKFYEQYGTPLYVTSAVRTYERQEVLILRNPNAARGETPERRSPHLTGSTIDIAKINLTEEQRVWLGAQLLLYEEQGRVEATEEFKQAVFHVMVLR